MPPHFLERVLIRIDRLSADAADNSGSNRGKRFEGQGQFRLYVFMILDILHCMMVAT